MTDINTPESVLLETKALMHQGVHGGEYVDYRFDAEGADSEAFPIATQISTLAWLEMGRPDVVTVSVQPGDHLTETKREIGPVGKVIARTIGYLVGVGLIIGIVYGLTFAVVGLSRLLEQFITSS